MRLLFTCRPGDGHFMPLLPLAEAAQRHGNEVCFASGEPTATKARGLGFQSEIAGLSIADTLAARTALLGGAEPPAAQVRAFAFSQWFSRIEAPRRLIELERIRARFRPDILLHEPAELAGPLAAAVAGIPWVTVGYGALLPPELPGLAAEALADLWRERGLEVPANAGLYRHLYVDPCPTTMQIAAAEALPARILVRPASAGVRRPFANRPVLGRVYVTFGTAMNLFDKNWERRRTAVAGAADAAREVIVTLGANTDPASLGSMPSHVDVRQYVPQDEILATCSAAVSHAGAGTLLGTLAWGVPSLLLPQGVDQFDNAARAVSAGAALALQPKDLTQEAVADGVRRLLTDPAVTPGLNQVRIELAAAPDIDTVVERIELLAKR